MIGFIIRRVLAMIPVLFLVALITFFMMKQAKGGPFDQEKEVAPSTIALLNRKFGLDKPAWLNSAEFNNRLSAEGNPFSALRGLLDSQFGNYMINAVQGDLGPTYASKGTETVQDKIKETFPISLRLGMISLAFALLVGFPLGILGALRQNTIFDYFSLILSTIGFSVPTFVTGLLLLLVMSKVFDVAPIKDPSVWQGFSTSYIPPAIILGLGTMAYITRLTRSSVLEVKRQDYIRTARAKGLGDRVVILRHILRNSLIPVITILGPAVAGLVTGSFIIESVFRVPGIGSEFIGAIGSRDYSMIMGSTLFFSLLVALGNIMVDLSYGLIDPRIRNS
ncbi:MAG: ABC transporter permease [Chloroflexi bacterium]|nr:ABC transporter permease [Chloroflexota bacterium]